MAYTYRFKSRKHDAFEILPTARPGVWIDAVGISDAEVQEFSEKHGLDDGHLRDAQDFFEAPRFEQEGAVTYLFTRYPAEVSGETTTAPILIVVGEDFICTVVHSAPEWLERFRERVDIVTTQKTTIFLHLLRAIEREYTRVFTAMRRDVRRARLSISDVSERSIEESVQLEYALNEFVSALVPTNAALQQVLTGKHLPLFEDDVELIEDVQLANGQLIESAKNALKTIQNIRSAHATLVSNRLNRVVRMLTALTMLLTIPTIIGALYGMNVPLPFQHSPIMFWFIIVFILLLVGVAVSVFKHKGWL